MTLRVVFERSELPRPTQAAVRQFATVPAMRHVCVSIALLMLAGCTQNHSALKAAQASLDRELAGLKAVADSMTVRSRRLSDIEARVQEEVQGRPSAPLPVAAPSPPIPAPASFVLPPPGLFEGAEGARLRDRIMDTERRIAELRRVIKEIETIDARTAELATKLEALRRARSSSGVPR
jgi:hypothetical protein